MRTQHLSGFGWRIMGEAEGVAGHGVKSRTVRLLREAIGEIHGDIPEALPRVSTAIAGTAPVAAKPMLPGPGPAVLAEGADLVTAAEVETALE